MQMMQKIAIAIIVLFLSFIGGYGLGIDHAENYAKAHLLAAERAASARYRAELARGDALAARLETVKTQTRTITKTIVREVNNYVTPLALRNCTIPTGFVRLHDAAAANRMPEAPGVDADAPGGIDLAAVAETVAENYGDCHAWKQQLNALIDWHDKATK